MKTTGMVEDEMKHWNAALILSLIFCMGCSVFGIRTSEELDYTVIASTSDVEIRQYGLHVVAKATLTGDHRDVQGELFRTLAGYIFGDNVRQEDIAMTAPVVMGGTG
jgi:hypothetical protein